MMTTISAKENLFYRFSTFLIFPLVLLLGLNSCGEEGPRLSLKKGDHIILVGNNLCSRMMNYGFFETELQLRYPDSSLYIRNMCDGGNTPGFRPHSGRKSPWAFPGADSFQTELANPSGSVGHFETPDQWISRHKADIILAFFGYNESFQGEAGLENFRAELTAFVKHSLSQKYNGETAPQLALISPISFEDQSYKVDLPSGRNQNQNLKLYTKVIKEVAAANQVLFLDAFAPSRTWFSTAQDLTIDGAQMTEIGYQTFSKFLVNGVFGEKEAPAEQHRELVHEAVMEKNWFWHNDFKIPNGVHVFGRRYDPFGPDNYPDELKKIREMTAIRDQAIWAANKGDQMDLGAADAKTHPLGIVETNYKTGDYGRGEAKYLYGEDAISKLKMAPGYKIELFASEKEFEDLANPVQLSFDNKGRLWVAVMPTYPHWRPGDPKPDDKLIILEDTDGDGKADKQTTFADGLHIPVGFEFAPEGVYVSQGTNLILLTDTNGDDKADKKEIMLSGFDDHDTHHVISAFCADPSGAIYMGEGVFLHTNVETAYGPVRGTNGGFYRYNPQRHHLERTAQLSIPNPWGIAFDEWGQNIFAETSGPAVRWMMPGSIKSLYGVGTHKSFDLVKSEDKVRPTSGLEFIYSRHFPDEVQGDLLINNNIGFLGMRQHSLKDDGTGYDMNLRQDLVVSEDGNFRPVDMEFAPDGSLYLIDWHNVLIGHMQHNARDPLRDHVHGRIYRITYPERPLLSPAKVAGASIKELLDNLKLPEYRTRYRSRRELRARSSKKVLSQLASWVDNLDRSAPRYEHHLLEAIWVSWGLDRIDANLLRQALSAQDYRVRAAAVKVLRYVGHQVEDQADLLLTAAGDEHGRVRLEALVAASWLDKETGLKIVNEAGKHPLDEWIVNAHVTALAHLNGQPVKSRGKRELETHLEGADKDLYVMGKEVYHRDGHCATCHQGDGKGLPTAGFPPLAGSPWVTQSEDLLIKISLKGLMGPMEVLGKKYKGLVPMTPHEGMLDDEEMSAVLTYVRNSFGNKASVVSADKVKKVRASVADKKGYYSPAELLQEYPIN
ncbi:MAG: PVC-type heme-binding CxxCH protein [Bacteroidota bacterium]